MDRPRTVEEFEREYAERSGMTVEALYAWGRRGAVCTCGEEGCEGFQMLHEDQWATTRPRVQAT